MRTHIIGLMIYTGFLIILCVFASIILRHYVIVVSISSSFAVCFLAGIIGTYFRNTTLLWIQFVACCLAILAMFGAATAISVASIFFNKPLDDRDVTAYTNPVVALLLVVIVFGASGGISLFFILGAWLTRRVIRLVTTTTQTSMVVGTPKDENL